MADNWQPLLRLVLAALVAGLAIINGTGVYGRPTEAHLGVTVAASSSITERIGALNARMAEQQHVVADLDNQISQIDAVIAQMTKRGRTTSAIAAIASQRQARETLTAAAS